MHQVVEAVLDYGDFFEIQPALRAEHPLRVRPRRRSPDRRRRESAERSGGRSRHRFLDQSGALRTLLRRVQHPAGHVRRRPRVLTRYRTGVRRHHPARRKTSLRVRGSDGSEDHHHHAQSLRRRVRRDGQQTHPRRLQRRVADGRNCGHGRRRRREDDLPPGTRRRKRSASKDERTGRRLRRAVRKSVHRRAARIRRRRHRGSQHARRRSPTRWKCLRTNGSNARAANTATFLYNAGEP